jgi:hypothetical protein
LRGAHDAAQNRTTEIKLPRFGKRQESKGCGNEDGENRAVAVSVKNGLEQLHTLVARAVHQHPVVGVDIIEHLARAEDHAQ